MEKLAHVFHYENYKSLGRVNVGTAERFGNIIVLMLKPTDVATTYMNIQKNGGSGYVVRLLSASPIYSDEIPSEIKANKKMQERLHTLNFDELSLIEMEFIEGNTLEEYYSAEGRLFDPKEMFSLTTKLFEGLDVIHGAGYYHGDIGFYQNIMLTPDGYPVIIDVEGGQLTNKLYSDDDRISLANALWQLIAGDKSYEEDDTGNMIMAPEPEFLKYFNEVRDDYFEYDRTLNFLYEIFIS